jgi:hypothetical protein
MTAKAGPKLLSPSSTSIPTAMREAYLTGGNDHFDATDTPAAPKPAEDLGLTKVKLNRKDSTLYAEYSEGEAGGYAEKTALHHRPAHADLEAAFARVLPHFLLMLEMLPGVQAGEEWLKNDTLRFRLMLEDGELHELPECKDYQLTGYAYSDKGGVVLLGRKTTRFGKVINLTTPHEVMDPEQPTGMVYARHRAWQVRQRGEALPRWQVGALRGPAAD